MIYGCIGEKLGHSFSVDIHRQLFDYSYELRELAPEELPAFMLEKDFKAINVTIPYKEAVIPFLDEVSDTARQIGAVNTIVNDNRRLLGYNTDFSGMCGLILRLDLHLADKNVLVLGSGGTSKTAVAVAKHLGCQRVHRVSRSGRDGCITYEQAVTMADTHVLINTTPCGMYPYLGAAAIDVAAFPMLEGVVDAVYNPLRSKLVCDAQRAGIPATGGLYMLVAQAAYAAEKFVGQEVPLSRIQEVYKRMVCNKQNLVLVGMPGCGKSTVGKRIARDLDMDFVDTDELIVQRAGKSIPEIFAQQGEVEFRSLETAVIADLAACQHTVIATGGGAVLREENVLNLRQNGRLYFIDRPVYSLIATADRPLSSTREDLQRLYKQRLPVYIACCDVHVQSDNVFMNTLKTIKEDFTHENTGD